MLRNLSIASQVALSPLETRNRLGGGTSHGVLWRDRFGISFQPQSNGVAMGGGARSRARPSCACLLARGLRELSRLLGLYCISPLQQESRRSIVVAHDSVRGCNLHFEHFPQRRMWTAQWSQAQKCFPECSFAWALSDSLTHAVLRARSGSDSDGFVPTIRPFCHDLLTRPLWS